MKRLFTLLILVNLYLYVQLYAQWSWLNPKPQGNILNQVLRLNNGNVISIGGYGTILLSTNNGVNWIVSHRVHDTSSVLTAIYRVNDNLIFAASHESRILRSTNSGYNWENISRVAYSYNFKRLFFRDSNTGFGLFSNAVYKTTNGGLNWFQTSILANQCDDICFTDDNTGFVAGGAIVDNLLLTWIYKSTNGGLNWFNLQPPDIGPIKRIQFLNPSVGYFSGYNSIYKTTNSGVNWFSLNIPAGNNLITDFHFFNEITGYAGSYESYFLKTTNGGINWSMSLLPYYAFNTFRGIWSISFTDELRGYALIHGHIIVRTDNAGLNWARLTNSMNPYMPLKSIEFLNNNTALLGGWGTTNDYIIWKTTDSGINWTGIVPYDYQTSTGVIYDIDFPSNSTGYAVGGGGSKGYVYKSTNSGNNWIKLDSMGTGSNHAVYFTSDVTGYVLGFSGEIFRTSNGGTNWTTFNSGVSFRLYSIHFVNSFTGYACGGDAVQKLLKTTDSGISWNQIYSTTGSSFSYITFINLNTGYLCSKGILKTTDEGNTWIQKTPGQLLNFHKAIFPSDSVGYAYASFGRLFKSTDSGESWGELFVPTDYHFADMNFLDNNTGYLIGDQGMILKTTNGGGNFVGIIAHNGEIPVSYSLSQNYPNPFNPVTKIRYEIPKSAFVILKIYNVLGMEVTALVNENKQTGSYEVEWDASNFPSGVYFYELTAGKFKQSKKMLMVK